MKEAILLFCILIVTNVYAQDTQTLRATKSFEHGNAETGFIKLLKNTDYTLFNDGKIKSGILAENTKLAFAYGTNNSAEFLSGTPIAFYPTGLVNYGMLALDTPLRYTYENEVKIIFAANSKIIFDANGLVISGTLAIDTEIPISDDSVLKFKSNTLFNISDLKEDN